MIAMKFACPRAQLVFMGIAKGVARGKIAQSAHIAGGALSSVPGGVSAYAIAAGPACQF
jgi:hypothetical protein